jgi:hypothetical protein
MARLPSEHYLMQQTGDHEVQLFEDGTERELVRFDPADSDSVELAQKVIYDSGELDDEDKAFALFWSGYFCAYAGYQAPDAGPVTYDVPSDLAGVFAGDNNLETVVSFDPRDASATARAQGAIYRSSLARDEKRAAHFWCGYFYGQACMAGTDG